MAKATPAKKIASKKAASKQQAAPPKKAASKGERRPVNNNGKTKHTIHSIDLPPQDENGLHEDDQRQTGLDRVTIPNAEMERGTIDQENESVGTDNIPRDETWRDPASDPDNPKNKEDLIKEYVRSPKKKAEKEPKTTKTPKATKPAKEPKPPKQSVPRRPIEVRSAALNLIFCNYTYDHTVAQHTTNNVSIKSQVPIHPDLENAFKPLSRHLAVICEETDGIEIPDINVMVAVGEAWPLGEIFDKFRVNAFKLDGLGENEAVILIGEKKLSTGDVVKLETPKILWRSGYQFINELQQAIGDLINEVEQYMNGKQAEKTQLELFPGDAGGADAGYSEPEL